MLNSTGYRWLIPALLLAVLGAWQFTAGIYIYLKAELAQILLESAWERTLTGEKQQKPWSWADTWPVARLYLPGQDLGLTIVSGSSPRNLAFGPGYVEGTSYPGDSGNTVIVGHRDTHFKPLQHLAVGNSLVLETNNSLKLRYIVTELDIAHESHNTFMAATETDTLTLITCYPFDALVPGGPLRYIVRAQRNTEHI
jgi:sortase A